MTSNEKVITICFFALSFFFALRLANLVGQQISQVSALEQKVENLRLDVSLERQRSIALEGIVRQIRKPVEADIFDILKDKDAEEDWGWREQAKISCMKCH